MVLQKYKELQENNFFAKKCFSLTPRLLRNRSSTNEILKPSKENMYKKLCLAHLDLEPSLLCRWFRFAQLAKGKKFRP
jgi:hypothetical protein